MIYNNNCRTPRTRRAKGEPPKYLQC